jgi:hypothetical protein
MERRREAKTDGFKAYTDGTDLSTASARSRVSLWYLQSAEVTTCNLQEWWEDSSHGGQRERITSLSSVFVGVMCGAVLAGSIGGFAVPVES